VVLLKLLDHLCGQLQLGLEAHLIRDGARLPELLMILGEP
jgi:hypothetical protein